jgi:hypothetical protein
MRLINYNIHNKLKIQVRQEEGFHLFDGQNDELNYFRVDDIDKPDITLNIRKFIPSNDGCCTVDNTYYVKKNYFYCRDLNNSIKWEVEINGFEEGDQNINLHYTTTSPKAMLFNSVYKGFALRPLIYKKLSEKGSFMIHAAGIVKDGDAYIFPGRGGSFKTSIVANFVKYGRYQFLGDDRVILDKNKVLNFPTFLPIVNYIYNHKENEHLNIFDKLIIMNSTLSNFNMPLIESGNLKTMFFLIRGNDDELNIHDLDNKTAIDKLITSIEMETNDQFESCNIFPYYKYVQIYSYIFPDGALSRYKGDLKRSLVSLLSDVKKYEIRVPYKYNNNICAVINSLIDKC